MSLLLTRRPCLLPKCYKTIVSPMHVTKRFYQYVNTGALSNQDVTSNEHSGITDAEHLSEYYQNNYKYSTEQILSSTMDMFSSADAVHLLKSLRIQNFMKSLKFKEIENDKRFHTVCKRYIESCHTLQPSLLISGVRSLLEIGMSPFSDLINDIELIILSRIKSFSMIELISCLHLHNKFLSTNRQKQVVTSLVHEIQQRMAEICCEAEVLMLIEVLHLFENIYQKELQNIIVKLLPNIKPKILIKIICTLAENTTRNTDLLNPVGFQLRLNEEKPSLKETVNILYALNTLNYHNPKLLSYLTNDRESGISRIRQPSIISGLLSACGQLKWRHSGILDACGLWISNHIDDCSSRELASYLLTIAALNYIPKDISIINLVKGHLKMDDVASKDVWLDIVWSLAVLDSLDKELLINVLSPDFYSPLLENSSFDSVTNKLKLLNLKSILKNQYPEFVFACDLFVDAPEVPQSKETKKCKDFVLETLSLFVPNEKYMHTNLNSDMGIIIDAEFIMENKGKPLLLSDYGLLSKPTTVIKDLPLGAKRIALMIWLYKDFTLNEKTLTGVNVLALRLLSNLGYTLAEIPYGTFIKNPTLVKKVMYLSETIKNTVIKSNKTAIENKK